MKESSSILIVEDELITAESIAELLEEEEFAVVGIAADAVTAMRIFSQAEDLPGVVICDVNLKGKMNGVELARQIREMYNSEIIFLTAYADTKTLESAFSTDPVMYLVKPYNDTQLLVAVQMAFHRLYKRSASQPGTKLELTEREREIAELVAQGLSSKQIARKLAISIETVKTHRRRMLQKNSISSFPHLIYLLHKDA